MISTRHKPILAVLTACALLGPIAARADDPKAEQLLAEAKAATGGAAWDKVTNWHESGELAVPQLAGSYELTVDFKQPRFALHYKLGPAVGAQGWDGMEAWSVDASGLPHAESSAEAHAATITQLYQAVLGYWYPERMKAVRSYAGERKDGKEIFDAVKIVPEGGDPIELWIDRKTHRITRELDLAGGQPQSTQREEFRQQNGIVLPFVSRSFIQGSADEVQRISIKTVTFNSEIAPASFSPPAPPAADFAFPAGQTHVSVPFTLVNNHIHLDIAFGSATEPMIFDTGATNVIDRAVATKLGLKSEGELPGSGFGEKTMTASLSKVDQIALGGVLLKDQIFVTFDLSDIGRAGGTPDAGLIGYEFAKRAVVEIDYPAHRLTLIKQDAFTPPTDAVIVPLKFTEHTPIIDATLDGIPGEYQLDTGSRGGLYLTKGFAAAHDLPAKYQATHEVISGYGIGGPSHGLLVRAGMLEIGSIKIAQPVAVIGTDKRGNSGSSQIAGNIGGRILKNFVLTLDYANARAYFRPAGDGLATPETYDRSGLWLMVPAKGDGIEILEVAAGSAGAKAKIASGERILKVDGEAAGKIGLPGLRERFLGAVGTKIGLSVQDAKGATREVTITLEDQV